MADSNKTEQVEIICVRCGSANDDRASRCAKCQTPLDDFASSSPWEMGTARSPAYAPVSNPRTKPIIFWGVWLFFGPTAIGSIWSIISYTQMLVSDDSLSFAEDSELIWGVLLSMGGMLVFGFLACWALWSVSRGYFKKQ